MLRPFSLRGSERNGWLVSWGGRGGREVLDGPRPRGAMIRALRALRVHHMFPDARESE